MNLKAIAFLAAIIVATGAPNYTLSQSPAEAKRLSRLSKYLRQSDAVLEGEAVVSQKIWEPSLEKLWEHAKAQHVILFGVAATNTRFDLTTLSTKSLEDRTFEILKALWGESWRDAIHPIPEGGGGSGRANPK